MKYKFLSNAVSVCLLSFLNTPSYGAILSPCLLSPNQYVLEDEILNLSISTSPNKTDGSEFIQVTLSNIDTLWAVDTSTGGGTYNAMTGVWSITLPAGTSLSMQTFGDIPLSGID